MHKPSADGSDESLLLKFPKSERHKNVSARGREPDAQISRFACRVGRIRKHAKCPSSKCTLDLLHRDTVLKALFAVSVVPVESFNCLYHTIRIPIVCTNVHAPNCERLPPATRASPCEPLFQRSLFQNSSAGDGRSLAIGPAVQIGEFNSCVFGGVRQWFILTRSGSSPNPGDRQLKAPIPDIQERPWLFGASLG